MTKLFRMSDVDIKESIGNGQINCYTCPVSNAIVRELKVSYKVSTLGDITIYSTRFMIIKVIPMPTRVKKWIRKHDNAWRKAFMDGITASTMPDALFNYLPKPINFKLDIPDEALR